ncbi:uncharacterized protein LOC132701610 [Cylas formicarius]|uniref:uncharacterized protein LOC132701610 n=1 Tax=Cylas formicarius TaxID=197179 RepID=UPI002958D154|nr:uncharacterized protein LOC132701610 [Cylas formicarius]
MSDQEIIELMDSVLPLVLESGKILLETQDESIEMDSKKAIWEVVTVYDQKIEDVLMKGIKELYPTHKIISEEECSQKDEIAKLTDAPTWIIDPIDATANFAKGMPITCISVGLTIGKEQILGIAYNPFMNELFTATKGRGAYLNGKKICTSGLTDIKRCIFNYEISLARTSTHLYNVYMFRLKHLITEILGIRSYGCPVLGLCYVACGRVDAYQCDGLYPWDAAAGTLIVKEAGGHVVDTTGKSEFDVMEPNFLATASKALSDKFIEIENRADRERSVAISNNKEYSPL